MNKKTKQKIVKRKIKEIKKQMKPFEILGQLGDIGQKIEQAELAYKMTKKTLELTNETNTKINTIIIPQIEHTQLMIEEIERKYLNKPRYKPKYK